MTEPGVLVELPPDFDAVGLRVSWIPTDRSAYMTQAQFGVYLDVRGVGESYIVTSADDGVSVWPTADLRLDLSDSTTRDRCLRWLAKRVGVTVPGFGSPGWVRLPGYHRVCQLTVDGEAKQTWRSPTSRVRGAIAVPMLASVRVHEDRRIFGIPLEDLLCFSAVLWHTTRFT